MTKLRRRPGLIGAGVLWIGGLGVLVGSLLFSTSGSASATSPSPPSPTFTANQGSPGTQGAWKVDGSGVTQPVSGTVGVNNFPATQAVTGGVNAAQSGTWNVGLSGSLPSGTNDIGTVHVASPTLDSGYSLCQVPTGAISCQTSSGVPGGKILKTLSVLCQVPNPGHRVTASSSLGIAVPLTFQMTSGGTDYYVGTLTDLDATNPATSVFTVNEDYTAAAGPYGALCYFDYFDSAS